MNETVTIDVVSIPKLGDVVVTVSGGPTITRINRFVTVLSDGGTVDTEALVVGESGVVTIWNVRDVG
jgi:hypothetical protein